MCWSPSHEEARAWLLAEMRAAGLETWVDPAGNVFGATGIRAIRPETPVVLTGSHIDTVPEGGILDGALGVLAGLECLHAIQETRTSHAKPLVVAAWSDEEGRYGSLFGSRAFCGMLDGAKLDEMAAVDGARLVDAMAGAGFDAHRAPEARVPAGAVAAYWSCISSRALGLEEAGIPIGVVETDRRRAPLARDLPGPGRPRRHHADGSPARRIPGLGRLRAARARPRRRAR